MLENIQIAGEAVYKHVPGLKQSDPLENRSHDFFTTCRDPSILSYQNLLLDCGSTRFIVHLVATKYDAIPR